MSDLLQVSDLEKAKLHDTFHSEVVTGKAGGLSTGANIDYATNAVTGQVQKTLPKILDDLDWSYVGLFADGVTFTKKSDFAVDAVGTQWIYTGSLPFSATAGTVPSEPTYQAVHVKSASAISNANGGSVQGFIESTETKLAELEQDVAGLPADAVEIVEQHNSNPLAHPELSAFITSEADRAEIARDAAFVNADVYPDIATGLAAVADGEQFQVVDTNGTFISRYKRYSGTAILVSRLPTAKSITGLPSGSLNSNIDFTRSRNLLDVTTATSGVVIDITGGIVPNSGYHISDFIAVKSSVEYSSWWDNTISAVASVAQYDIKGNFISRPNTVDGKITTGEYTSYVRLNLLGDIKAPRMFCQGETPSEYVPPSLYIHRLKVFPSSLEHGSIPPEKTSFIKTGANLLDLEATTLGVVVSPSGEIVPNSTYSISELIYVKPNTTYSAWWEDGTYTGVVHVSQYDSEHNFISRLVVSGGKVTTGGSTASVRLNILGSPTAKRMFCEGELPAEYEPYKFSIPKLTLGVDKLKDGSITPEKTSFIETGKNLLDLSAATSGVVISNTGEIVSNSTYSVSDFIAVKPNTQYRRWWVNSNEAMSSVALYDENKQFLSRLSDVLNPVITTDSNTFYVRINILGDKTAPRMFYEGDIQAEYEPYKFSIPKLTWDVGNLKDGSITPEKTSFIGSTINLLDLSAATQGVVISSSGEIVLNPTYSISEFIVVKPDTQYRRYWDGGSIPSVALYDENKQFISRRADVSNPVITTGSNTHYVRLNILGNLNDRRMFYEGSAAIPYVEHAKYLTGVGLSPEYVDKLLHAPDRLMVDMPIEGLFVTDEVYTDQWSNFGSSTTAAEVYAKYDELVVAHPKYVSKQALGVDDYGNEIAVYHFTPVKPSSSVNTRYPKIFLTTGTHGDEHPSGLTAYLMLKSLCDEWQRDPLLEAIRFNVEILIIPVTNPSGWDGMTRKNRNGVDINRNFPEGWKLTDPATPTYGGAAPLSEPESLFISQVLEENPDIGAFYDFHSFNGTAETTNFIWVSTFYDPKAQQVQHMSQMLIQRMTRHWRNEYSWIPSDPTWFAGYTDWSNSGMIKDHAHHGHGVPFAAVFEVAGRWWLQPEASAYNLEHRQSAVNSLVNWLLVNLREIIRRG